MDEQWKTIPISTGYEASTHGRVRNKKTGQVIKSNESALGYRVIGIKGTYGENITRLVHRLVAFTFIPNPEKKATVNHKDHGRSNNNVCNLEWASFKEQAVHARSRKLTSAENAFKDNWGKRKLWKCDKETGEKLAMFQTVRDAASSMQSRNAMSQIYTVAENHEISQSIPGCRQGLLTAMGFQWQFDTLRAFIVETWEDLGPGAEDYEISSLGRLSGPIGQVKSPFGPGYPSHSIHGVQHFAHRLVAMTFLERIEGKDYVNHIDGSKNNPCVENLEFVTLSENAKHAHATGLVVPQTTKILQYDLQGNLVQKFKSVKKARLEVGSINLHRSINTNSASGGYIWKNEADGMDQIVELKPTNYRYKKVKQYDMNLAYIREWDSIGAAQKAIPGLQLAAANKGGSSAGYRWKYSNDTTPFTKRTSNDNKKKINQYDLDMNFLGLHESIAAARVQVPGVSIHWAIKHSKPSKGFRWAYA